MPGAVLPPYGAPSGPFRSQEELVRGFVEGDHTGSCGRLHIEGECLMALDLTHLAIRLGDGAVLIRRDVPLDVVPIREEVARSFGRLGLELIEEDARLGDVVGLQIAGLRGAMWSLWATDATAGNDLLRARAAEDMLDLLSEPAPDAGAGLLIEEVLANYERDLQSETENP